MKIQDAKDPGNTIVDSLSLGFEGVAWKLLGRAELGSDCSVIKRHRAASGSFCGER